jgi:hypothetical protein
MQSFGFAGSDSIARARAEIKSRLLGSVSLTAPPKLALQEGGEGDAQPHSEGEPTLPAGEKPELIRASASSDDQTTEGSWGEVKWIEPVFVEPVFGDGSPDEDCRTDAVIDDTQAPDTVPAFLAADGASADAARIAEARHLEEAQDLAEARVPRASPRPTRFWWGRRSPAVSEMEAGAATQPNAIAAEREALVDEVAALRRTLAAERAAAAARIAALEAGLGAKHEAAAERVAVTDEIAAMQLTRMAELAAAAEEIATLRRTITAERGAAADEIATLRTILAAQQEAAIARTTRIKAALGATAAPPAPAGD